MIQPYSLGTSVTRIDGANIATGTINADNAILTGSLSADTIKASSLTASLVFIPALINGMNNGTLGTYLDGSSIRTGTVSANRINVDGIVQIMNGGSVTKINGGAILCDSVLAANIATQGLTADAIKTGTLSATRVDVNGIITLVNGGSTTKLTGNGIETNSITTSHIATAGLDAGVIKTGSLLSAGTGGSYAPLVFTPATVPLAVTSANTFARTDGGSFLLDGYVPGQTLVTAKWTQGNNNGAFIIATVGTSTITTTTSTLTVETAATGRYFVGREIGFKISHTPFTTTLADGTTLTIQADFGNAIAVSGYPLGPALNIGLSALDFPPLGSLSASSLVFYRGNNNPSDGSGGAPKIADSDGNPATNPRLLINTVMVADSGSGNSSTTLHFQVQPVTNADNLDAISHVEVIAWYKSGANMIAKNVTVPVPVSSRRYKNLSTPSDPGNAGHGMWTWDEYNTSSHSAAVGLSGATYPLLLQCRICNVYGDSTQHYFLPPTVAGSGSSVSTGRWTDVGSVAPYPGGTAGSSGAGSGGGGGAVGCVPAGTLLVLADGSLIPIETVSEGQLVLAYDDQTLDKVSASVVKVFCFENREIYRVTTDRGSIVCSHDHRFVRMTGIAAADYPAARNLEPGDLVAVQGTSRPEYAIVKSSESLNYFDTVYHVQLDNGHLFVAGGFIAHNKLTVLCQSYN